MNLSTPRFLVTGADGFIGREVIRTLNEQGNTVRGAVMIPGPEHEELRKVMEVFGCGDIGSGTEWRPALEDVDVVIHLAGIAHRSGNDTPESEYDRVNHLAAVNLARQALSRGIRRFVFVSTAKVHGETSESGVLTEDSELNPPDPYSQSKLLAEQELARLAVDGMGLTVIRPVLVYGPGVRANFLQLMKLVDSGLPLPFGALHDKRSMVYVRNLADALVRAGSDTRPVSKYLVSDGEDLSVRELVARLAEFMKRPSRVVAVPVPLLRGVARLSGMSRKLEKVTDSFVVDSSAIRKALEWSPPYSVDEGIRATAEWFRQR